MPDINVSITSENISVELGQVLPIYQQKEVHKQHSFTATANQTVFNLSSIPRADSTQVFKNGILLGADEYTIIGSTLTTDEGLDANDILDAHYIVA